MNTLQQNEAGSDDCVTYRFRLYVAGDGTNSAKATANLAGLCRVHLAQRCTVEIVDVFQEPIRALEDGVFMTPTLLKLAPVPARKIVGTLDKMSSVLAALNLEDGTA